MGCDMRVISASWNDEPVALIEGALPSEEDLSRIRHENLQVHVLSVPDGVTDLGFLRPVADTLGCLHVSTSVFRDVAEIEGMDALERLRFIEDCTFPAIDLTKLSRLRWFGGEYRYAPSLSMSESLRSLAIKLPDPTVLIGLRARLSYLGLQLPRKSMVFPALAGQDHLKTVTVTGARGLDISSLSNCPALEDVFLLQCGDISSASVLLQLKMLRRVTLYGSKLPGVVIDELRSTSVEVDV